MHALTIDDFAVPSGAAPAYSPAAWKARLALRFGRRSERTVLVARSHFGPLVVQKTLYPEGPSVCHAIVLHPPGGVAGGDDLYLQVALEDGAHVLLTTPGAGKWYKANGRRAAQTLQFAVDDASLLEWLPQENIVFDAADVHWRTCVDLGAEGRYAGWDIFCLGRQAAGECFVTGCLNSKVRLLREGRALWHESAVVRAGDALIASPLGMQGCSVSAGFVVAAGTVPPEVLNLCRDVRPADEAGYGVTALPELFVARYLGNSAQSARRYCEALWNVLRPWYAGMPAERPRIWNT